MGILTTARARSQQVTILNHTWGVDEDAGAIITETTETALACSIFPGEPVQEVIPGTERWTTTVYYRLHFNVNPGVKPRDELQWTDGTTVHTMAVINSARNVAGQGRTYEVFAVERV